MILRHAKRIVKTLILFYFDCGDIHPMFEAFQICAVWVQEIDGQSRKVLTEINFPAFNQKFTGMDEAFTA